MKKTVDRCCEIEFPLMSLRPLVSIIVPSFNQGQFIEETLLSCFDQDYRPIEVIVTDGGSPDQTVDVLRRLDRPELRWVSEPDDGVVDAVNKGLKIAKGEIFSIQSSDDVFVAGAISAAVEAFIADRLLALVFGDIVHIDKESREIGSDVQGDFNLSDCLGRFSYIPQPGTFFRRDAWLQVGGWRREFSYVADADLWLRIALRFPVKKLDRMVAKYRYHDEQRDRNRPKIADDWKRMIDDLIESSHMELRYKTAAKMGCHLASYKYLDGARWWVRTVALYRALWVNPVAILDRRFPRRELLPGRQPIWKLLSRVKRYLGFTPRQRAQSRVV